MTITILGSGTAIPVHDRAPAAVLWQSGEETILFDIGPGTLLRLEAQGVDFRALQKIFLTHLHSDHTLDLVTFLQANDSLPEPGRLAAVSLTGCKGTQEFFTKLMEVFPGISSRTYSFSLHERGVDSWQEGGFEVTTALTCHTPSSLAYRIDSSEGSFVYTGDAVLNEGLIELCRGVDLLICDCSFPAEIHSPDHMNAHDVGVLAAKAGVVCVVPTHFYPQALASDIESQIRQSYSGRIILASDGLHLEIRSGKEHQ
jgi:ribonuclease BN (tRNA processing enzyme)